MLHALLITERLKLLVKLLEGKAYRRGVLIGIEVFGSPHNDTSLPDTRRPYQNYLELRNLSLSCGMRRLKRGMTLHLKLYLLTQK